MLHRSIASQQCVFLYVDVNVKLKGQAEICEPIGDRFLLLAGGPPGGAGGRVTVTGTVRKQFLFF